MTTTTNTDALRTAIEAAMRRRDPCVRVSVTPAAGQTLASIDGPSSALVWGSSMADTADEALRRLSRGFGLRDDGSDPAADDPALDGTDGAHPAWWRGHDRATEVWRERVTTAERERDDVARGALDDLARVRAELDAARAALRQYAPRCECGALATRTVGYDDCEPSTLRRVCDREVCGRGLPVSGESAHAAAVRAAVLR